MKTMVLSAIAVVMMTSAVWSQQPQMFDDRPRISVTGEAVVNVTPDKIVLTLGIETWDAEITTAREKTNDILKQTLTALKELGIPDKAIQTDQLSVEPRYNDDYKKQGFIGFFVRTTLVVTLSDPEKVETLVTKVLQAGVNYIHGIEFQTTEFRKHRDKARELALKAAREKAEMMAGALGESVGEPIQITEQHSGQDWWYYSSWSGWGFGRRQGMSQNVMQNASSDTGAPTESIALGKISIRANVSVVFALKK